MKKAISLILALVLCLSLCACGSNGGATETTEASKPEIPTAQVGKTVSTDIVDLTLEHSKLTYYVSNLSSTYVAATEEANTLFAAKVGTCYVSMTVTVTNKDRGGSLDFCGAFSDWDPADWSVTYNGAEYDMYGFDLNTDNYDNISLSHGAIVDKDTGTVLDKVGSNNKLISAGQTITLRFFGIIKVDPASLNDGFELNVKVPNSKGVQENFKYIVPNADAPLDEGQKADIYDKVARLMEREEYYFALENLARLGDYKDSADLYDFCMRRYAAKVGMWNIAEEYLTQNMDSFPKLTGDKLKEIIPGNSWYLQGVGSNGWKYLEDGTINDGWGNDRGWSVEGDLLVIRTGKNNKKVSVLELYDGGYVLLEDGKYYATLYKVAE